jgi:hypothetical protein
LRGWRPADNPPPVQNAGHSKLFSSGDETAIRDLAAQIGHPRQTPSQSLLGNLITLASVASMAELRLEIDALANGGKFTGRAFQRRENATLGQQFSALMHRFYHPDEDAAPNDETVTHNRAKRANALRYLTQLRGLTPQRRGNRPTTQPKRRRKHGSRNRKRKR